MDILCKRTFTQPPIHDSRKAPLNVLMRLLEGSTPTHIALQGLPGSGRHTITDALCSLARSINRKHILTLDVGELVSQLYEPIDISRFFQQLQHATHTHRRAIIVVDDIDLLIDGIERHETRRLGRFFKQLLDDDCRCICITTEDQTLAMRSLSATIRSVLTTVNAVSLSENVTAEIVNTNKSTTLGSQIAQLATRFYPDKGLPGSALQLFDDASDIAQQQAEPFHIRHVHQVISQQRKLPLSAISNDKSTILQDLSKTLSQRVIGQDHAVNTVSKVIRRSHVGLTEGNRPLASFLFLGPSGVGKTELAKGLADTLFQSPRSFTRIDMSEFSEAHTVQRLIGSPPGYVGYEEGGQLTNPVAEEPYSLVLLDEIEKAHPKVFDVFLQLLDDGRLTDGRGKTVDFTHTIVVATSNVGIHDIVKAAETGAINNREQFLRQTLLPLLVEHFRPEFLNRFDAIIAFSPLDVDRLTIIAQQQITQLQTRLQSKNITLNVSQETLHSLAKRAYQPTFGARPLRRLVQDEVESAIAERLLDGSIKHGESVAV